MKRPEEVTDLSLYNRTHPHYKVLDELLWAVSRITSKVSDNKITLNEHWMTVPIITGDHWVALPGDPDAPKIHNFIDLLKAHLYAWKTAYVIKPDKKNISWQYAFADSLSSSEMKVCRIIIPDDRGVKILRGPDNFMVAGFNLFGRGIPLTVEGPISRKEKRNLPIL